MCRYENVTHTYLLLFYYESSFTHHFSFYGESSRAQEQTRAVNASDNENSFIVYYANKKT